MKDTSVANEAYKLWVRLHQSTHAIQKARDRELRPLGISTMYAAVLFVVQANDSRATPAEISRWIFRERHTVIGVLNRMEKKGLIRRVRDLDRKNLVRIALTEKGRKAYDESMKTEEINRIISVLSKEECRQLDSGLDKVLNKALTDLGVVYKLPFP